MKEIGKFIQNARTLGAEAAKSFEGTMEDQLELTELRRAQSELNSAFGFRRSINTSEFGEAFDRSGFGEALDGSGAGVAATAVAGSSGSNTSTGSIMTEVGEEEEEDSTPKRKRRLVRRKKKKVVVEEDIPSLSEGEYDTKDFALEYPDLDMLDSVVEDENNDLRAQRMERLQSSATTSATTRSNEKEEIMDWFTSSEEDIAATILNQPTSVDNATSSYEKQRFQTQLSADEWNAQIMAREDELSPCKCSESIRLSTSTSTPTAIAATTTPCLVLMISPISNSLSITRFVLPHYYFYYLLLVVTFSIHGNATSCNTRRGETCRRQTY